MFHKSSQIFTPRVACNVGALLTLCKPRNAEQNEAFSNFVHGQNTGKQFKKLNSAIGHSEGLLGRPLLQSLRDQVLQLSNFFLASSQVSPYIRANKNVKPKLVKENLLVWNSLYIIARTFGMINISVMI